jgi:hypothetical protein
MDISEYEARKKQWQEVRYWTGIMGVPVEKYDGLSDYLKGILHKIICKPQQITTEAQKNDLFSALISGSISGREAKYIDLSELRDKILRSVTEQEIKDYLSKF